MFRMNLRERGRISGKSVYRDALDRLLEGIKQDLVGYDAWWTASTGILLEQP
jgi:hypothetical protein